MSGGERKGVAVRVASTTARADRGWVRLHIRACLVEPDGDRACKNTVELMSPSGWAGPAFEGRRCTTSPNEGRAWTIINPLRHEPSQKMTNANNDGLTPHLEYHKVLTAKSFDKISRCGPTVLSLRTVARRNERIYLPVRADAHNFSLHAVACCGAHPR